MMSKSKEGLSIITSGAPGGMGAAIRRAARQTLRSQGYDHGRLEVTLVEETEMRRQHRRWMGRAVLTDVLSFDLRDRRQRGRVDGQLIVCETVARRVARLHHTDWRGELLLYVVHGCLHLCGHDDQRPADAARMHQQEDELLRLLGWGPVFYGSAGAGGCEKGFSRQGRIPARRERTGVED
jgi:probable rRNA maturation factor